jgi:hypothetical protein
MSKFEQAKFFTSEMVSAIAPITGRFRRRIYRDLVGSLSLGTGLAFAWWYGYSRAKFTEYRNFNEANKKKMIAEEEQWMTENNYSRQ